jgi:hypothetical protein
MHLYARKILRSFHGTEFHETKCVKLEIFADPFCWAAGGTFFESSRNANTPEQRQFSERRPNLLNILRASSRHYEVPTYSLTLMQMISLSVSGGRVMFPNTLLYKSVPGRVFFNRSRTKPQLQHHRNTLQSLLQARHDTPANNEHCVYGITLSS